MPQDLFASIYGQAPQAPAGNDLFSSVYGTAPAAPKEPDSFFTPLKTAAGSAFEFLNRPSRAVAESALAYTHDQPLMPAIKKGLAGESTASFEDLLKEKGMDPGWKRTLAGLGLDIVTDPLNLVGGLPFKAVKALDKLPMLARAEKAMKEVPLVEAMGKRFVPHFGLPEDYTKSRRLLESEMEARRGQAYHAAVERFKGVSPEDAKKITLSLDKPGGSTGVEKLDQLANAQKGAFEDQKTREIAAGVLDPAKVEKDYVTYLFKGQPGEAAAGALDASRGTLRRAMSAKNPFANPRELKSIEQALYLGAEPHIAKIAAVRAATGDRSIAVANFFKDAASKFSVPAEAAPAGFRGVNIAADMPVKSVFAGRAFDPKVADDLEKLVAVTQSPDAASELFRTATGIWKGYATAANPGFHVRNLVSNLFNSWLGGMQPAMAPMRYAEAAAAQKGAVRAIGGHAPEAIQKAMADMGVVGTGHGAFGDIGSAMDTLVHSTSGRTWKASSAVNPLSTQNILQSAGRHLGTGVENLSRVALFLDQLHKGNSLEDAALHVRKYLFDYGELTDFEKGIRNTAVPFYTWIRKNLPLQLESLLSQPEKYAHTGKVINKVEEASQEKGIGVPKGDRPEWLQKQDAVQVPFTTNKGEKLLLNPDLPFQDLNLLPVDKARSGQMGEAGTEVGKSIISILNPWLKVPAELSLNREAYTDREIVDPALGPGALVKAPAHIAVLAEQSPKVAEQLGVHKSISRLGQVQWMMPARAAYLASQIPFFSKLGKAVYTPEGMGKIDVPHKGGVSPGLASYLGFSLTPLDDTNQAVAAGSRMKRNVQQQRGLNRQGARFQPTQPSRIDEALRIALGGSSY